MAKRGMMREQDVKFAFGNQNQNTSRLRRGKKKKSRMAPTAHPALMALQIAKKVSESDEDLNKRKDLNRNIKKRYVETFNGFNRTLGRSAGLPHPNGRIGLPKAQSLVYGEDEKLLRYASDVRNQASNYDASNSMQMRSIMFNDEAENSNTFQKYINNIKRLLRRLEKASGVPKGQLLQAKEIKFNVVYYTFYK